MKSHTKQNRSHVSLNVFFCLELVVHEESGQTHITEWPKTQLTAIANIHKQFEDLDFFMHKKDKRRDKKVIKQNV